MNKFKDRITSALSFKSSFEKEIPRLSLNQLVQKRLHAKRVYPCSLHVWSGDICYGRNSMGNAVSISTRDLSALFCLGAPVKCNSPVLSVSTVHHDECRATFAPLLPSPHGSPSISAHYTPLARCQSAVPEILCRPAEEFAGRWHGSSSLLLACLSHSVIYSC